MERQTKGLTERIIKEPAKEVLSWTWKLSAAGAIISVALGLTLPAVKLAFIAIVTNYGSNELTRSMQNSPASSS